MCQKLNFDFFLGFSGNSEHTPLLVLKYFVLHHFSEKTAIGQKFFPKIVAHRSAILCLEKKCKKYAWSNNVF